MKQKINSILLQTWSSSLNGVDLTKAVEALDEYFEDEKTRLSDKLTETYEDRINELEDDLDDSKSTTYYFKEALKESEVIVESLEEDMELSNDLLVEFIPVIKAYKDIQSNHPIKYQELSTLLFKVEEQIIKNGK